jgi:hypothetical protein
MRDNLGMMAVNLSVHVKMVVQECTNVLQSKSFMCIGYEMKKVLVSDSKKFHQYQQMNNHL